MPTEPVYYTVKVRNNATGEITETRHRSVINLAPSKFDRATAKVRVSVKAGGDRTARLLAEALKPYNLAWVPGPEAWDTKGSWGHPETHKRLREVLEAAGFEVEDELETTKP
jgi:hypothetical protein